MQVQSSPARVLMHMRLQAGNAARNTEMAERARQHGEDADVVATYQRWANEAEAYVNDLLSQYLATL